MLIDNITIRVKAGQGGDGTVAFNKNMKTLGPVGGDGGKGGDIYCNGVSDLSMLAQFRNRKELKTEAGANGRGQSVDGADGKDLVFKVPIGTVVTNLATGEMREIVAVGERLLLAKGGKGGIGNFKFRSATNTSPRQFTLGKPGEEYAIRLELKLIADVGLIGLPNAGKTSLLNELTRANSKVANYPFTTLEPNLGAYYELIIADIPGLIEGASAGRGLGTKFLQHIERTKILFHLISLESIDPIADYRIVRKELELYNPTLLQKPEYIFLSKSDILSADRLSVMLSTLSVLGQTVIPISIHNAASIYQVRELLNKIKQNY